MIIKIDKNADRLVRHARVREKLSGTKKRPRFNVYRSLTNIYVQVIDDDAGRTIVSASSLEKSLAKQLIGKTKREASKIVGEAAAKKALAAGIKEIVFDRGGYIYTGRVKAVADGAREAGLKF
jgi:large subunit ribosomal protein L18